jgi:secreted trypsin-like serine protease
MWKKVLGACSAAVWLSTGCGTVDATTENVGSVEQEVVRGTPVPVSDVPSIGRPYVVLVLFQTYDMHWSACSGTYIAPRVVLTAAHCIPPQYVANGFIYWGNDFLTDGSSIDIPPTDQPSLWARADSWQIHPDYVKNVFDADMAVVYLDRKAPFDPLPLYRSRLDSSWTNQLATLVGWGANKALSEDIQENEGFGIKRTGRAPILGTPKLADYEPTADEAPLLTPTVRGHNVKLGGRVPYSNLCSGDSGGPMIVSRYGQDYVAGVASRTGEWCEDLSLYTRIDPYLPFLDDAYRKGGQAPLVPSLDCVDTWNGKLTAYFGYKNDNGVSIGVPYSTTKNYFPLDVQNARPALFKPGNNRFQFGIDFKAGQNLYWKLSPPNSPVTEVRASISSPRCADGVERRCARYCQATLASECADNFDATWDSCFNPCVEGYKNQWVGTTCEDEWNSYLTCVTNTPAAQANWACEPGFDTLPRAPACDAFVEAALNCLYPPPAQ